tara:strand:+ start:332 stop:1018 length:687 start_codon:yes stop_codon:yes gene_type:complete
MNTCNSKDYKNDWYNTWEFNILMIRKFIKEVGSGIDIEKGKITDKKKIDKYLFSKNYKVLESIILSDSLQNLESSDNYTRKDADNVLAYFKRKLENNEEDDLHPKAKQFVIEAIGNMQKGMNTDTAFKRKKQGTGRANNLDETSPPEYIFDITNLILNPKGMTLNMASENIKGKDILTPTHMQDVFHKYKKFGYVNWRFQNDVVGGIAVKAWTASQKKFLKKYWGLEF